MGYAAVTAGQDLPNDINVIIEISAFASPIKYEVDKDTDLVWVDRLQGATMAYPANYGYINQTLANDGDPVDVLVVTPHPLMVGSVIRCRPIGVLKMTDDGGEDAKVIAVPVNKLTPIYKDITAVEQIPLLKEQIEHFFKHYKDLEPGKWVKIDGWEDVESARKEILEGAKRYQA
ncbi:inorganic diphosphatase [Thiomicrospira microaerophila]|uniref:inorganic diphosphatase n=1 Tax=Thiomicrospira microaerophila TaxID=406020 RepID=UPI00200E9873|nr:inorganic diphosphatase [Thiomicrospira microaerophila]UQB41745.1 inorganic diphosphatase [Thiomicrospira microaerophila]